MWTWLSYQERHDITCGQQVPPRLRHTVHEEGLLVGSAATGCVQAGGAEPSKLLAEGVRREALEALAR
jgi:hypothetical protein